MNDLCIELRFSEDRRSEGFTQAGTSVRECKGLIDQARENVARQEWRKVKEVFGGEGKNVVASGQLAAKEQQHYGGDVECSCPQGRGGDGERERGAGTG